MAKMTIKQREKLEIVLFIFGAILALVAFGFFIYLTIFHVDYGRVYNAYVKYQDEYYTLEVTVEEIVYGAEYATGRGFMYTKSPWKETFVICEPIYRMLEESDFFDVVSEDTVITITTHPYIAWDGWPCPVVGVVVGDKTYVDFETGKQNWLDWLKLTSEEFGFLQTPIKVK